MLTRCLSDDPLVPLHLLIWSVQTFITTLVCIVEYCAWEGVSNAEVISLSTLYGPYCALGTPSFSLFLCRPLADMLRSGFYGCRNVPEAETNIERRVECQKDAVNAVANHRAGSVLIHITKRLL